MNNEILEQGFILTFDELKILLHSIGVREIQGIYMAEKIYQEPEIIYAMHHLSEMGFITAVSDRFVIRPDLKALLEIMAFPDWTDIWAPKGEYGPAFFLYSAEDSWVVSEAFHQKKDTLRVTMFDNDSFDRWRSEWIDDHN